MLDVARPRAFAVQVDRGLPRWWRAQDRTCLSAFEAVRTMLCRATVGNAKNSFSPTSDVEVVLIGSSHLGMYGAMVVVRKECNEIIRVVK